MTTEQFYDSSPYLPSETILGTPGQLVDSRVWMEYPFTDDDISYLQEHGATICDVLPVEVQDAKTD